MFDYVKFDDTREVKQATLKAHIEAFWRVVEANLAPGPERQKAQNKMEEMWMWCGKALKAEQLGADGAKGFEKEGGHRQFVKPLPAEQTVVPGKDSK